MMKLPMLEIVGVLAGVDNHLAVVKKSAYSWVDGYFCFLRFSLNKTCNDQKPGLNLLLVMWMVKFSWRPTTFRSKMLFEMGDLSRSH